MPIRPLLVALLLLVPTVAACGGGGDDQDPIDPLQLLEGSWKGPCLLGGLVIDMTVSPTGELTQLDVDGVSENATGTFSHITGRLYGITFFFLSGQTAEYRLLLDPTGAYAAMAEVDQSLQMIALQKGATAVPPRTLADYAPGQYQGEAAAFDGSANLLALDDCDVDIDAGAEFDGQFGTLLFSSPPASPLDLRVPVPDGTVLEGDYDDNDATTNANLFLVVTCPDGGAVAIIAVDTVAGVMRFFGLLATR